MPFRNFALGLLLAVPALAKHKVVPYQPFNSSDPSVISSAQRIEVTVTVEESRKMVTTLSWQMSPDFFSTTTDSNGEVPEYRASPTNTSSTSIPKNSQRSSTKAYTMPTTTPWSTIVRGAQSSSEDSYDGVAHNLRSLDTETLSATSPNAQTPSLSFHNNTEPFSDASYDRVYYRADSHDVQPLPSSASSHDTQTSLLASHVTPFLAGSHSTQASSSTASAAASAASSSQSTTTRTSKSTAATTSEGIPTYVTPFVASSYTTRHLDSSVLQSMRIDGTAYLSRDYHGDFKEFPLPTGIAPKNPPGENLRPILRSTTHCRRRIASKDWEVTFNVFMSPFGLDPPVWCERIRRSIEGNCWKRNPPPDVNVKKKSSFSLDRCTGDGRDKRGEMGHVAVFGLKKDWEIYKAFFEKDEGGRGNAMEKCVAHAIEDAFPYVKLEWEEEEGCYSVGEDKGGIPV